MLACYANSTEAVRLGYASEIDAGFASKSAQYAKPFLDNCTAPYVAFNRSGEYKYLAILDGNGYTERFKSYTGVNSLLIWWPTIPIKGYFEHFYAGFKNGYNIMIVNSFDELLAATRWARTHDAQVQKMVERMNRFSAWIFHEDTTDCYLYTLLNNYARAVNYRPNSSVVRELSDTDTWVKLDEVRIQTLRRVSLQNFTMNCEQVRRARPH